MSTILSDEGTINLAVAIIEQAKDDYMLAQCLRDGEKIEQCSWTVKNENGEREHVLSPIAAQARIEIEKFVRSEWFGVLSLCGLDPDKILNDWRREAKESYWYELAYERGYLKQKKLRPLRMIVVN